MVFSHYGTNCTQNTFRSAALQSKHLTSVMGGAQTKKNISYLKYIYFYLKSIRLMLAQNSLWILKASCAKNIVTGSGFWLHCALQPPKKKPPINAQKCVCIYTLCSSIRNINIKFVCLLTDITTYAAVYDERLGCAACIEDTRSDAKRAYAAPHRLYIPREINTHSNGNIALCWRFFFVLRLSTSLYMSCFYVCAYAESGFYKLNEVL